MTLGEAAKESGRSKGTISKALSSGALSYVEKNDAGYKIDPAELFRVFPKKTVETVSNERLETQENTIENRVLKREVELLREQLTREREQADHWRLQAERVSLLLTHQTEKPEPQKAIVPETLPEPKKPQQNRTPRQKIFGTKPPIEK